MGTVYATSENCTWLDVTAEDMSEHGDYYPAYDISDLDGWWEFTPDELVTVLADTMTHSARTHHRRRVARRALRLYGPDFDMYKIPLSVMVKAATLAKKIN